MKVNWLAVVARQCSIDAKDSQRLEKEEKVLIVMEKRREQLHAMLALFVEKFDINLQFFSCAFLSCR